MYYNRGFVFRWAYGDQDGSACGLKRHLCDPTVIALMRYIRCKLIFGINAEKVLKTGEVVSNCAEDKECMRGVQYVCGFELRKWISFYLPCNLALEKVELESKLMVKVCGMRVVRMYAFYVCL